MARVLGLNAVFHDPAAALVVDGEVVAAAEEERFSRRKHGKDPVAFSTWDLAAELLAADAVVGWFQGRSEFGPRALGHRSLLANPGPAANTERLNTIKGREQFRPIAPIALEERSPSVLAEGPISSPHMLFTHRLRPPWDRRLAAVAHVDGTDRAQTVDAHTQPLLHRLVSRFEQRTALFAR